MITTKSGFMKVIALSKINRSTVFIVLMSVLLACKPSLPDDTTLAHQELPDKIDFNFHVRPILSDRCYKCHGPDEKARKAGLRFDQEEAAFAMLDSAEGTFAIVPGNLKKSQMVRRISSVDPDFQMPPPESNLSLSDREIEILKRWIDQGAEWKLHWAFIPPKKAELPKVSNPDWPHNPIDLFIQGRLKREGLGPSPEATNEKLIRRLSFDIRGIPPSLEEIDIFLADTSPGAYEKVVDGLLSSQSYGERMTLEWLDLARYADSHGYQDDLERSQWPWRDWVIRAFNQNMPYDQFVTWQLAGDLFPEASYEQKLATAFNRNHKITQEVGVVDEEYRVEYVLDRVNTFSTSFLGLTVGCAQCHDHKFDPISQKEFYSLFSFFNSVPEAGRVEYGVEVADPSIPLPDSIVEKYTNHIQSLVSAQQQEVASYERSRWEKGLELSDMNIQLEGSGQIPSGLIAYYSLDYIENNEVQEELRTSKSAKVVNGLAPMPGKFSGGLEFTGQNYLDLGPIKELSFKRPVSISFWLYTIENGARGTLIAPKPYQDGRKPGFMLGTFDDGIRFELTSPSSDDTHKISVQTKHILPGNQWVNIVLTYDGSGKARGIKLYLNGVAKDLDITKDNLQGTTTTSTSILVGFNSTDCFSCPKGLIRSRMDELMIFNRGLDKNEVQSLAGYNPLKSLMTKPNKSDHDIKRLFYHQLHHSDPDYQMLTTWLSEYKVREMRTETVVLNPTMVMAEMDTIRPTYVLDRGKYSAPTERVYMSTPKHVLPFPNEYPKNRLGLAQWLFDDQNPLTARVAVNRYWQMIFGRGIVVTTEDFGSQGDLPSHPELLDWLALEFRSSGWDVKKLIKTMTMSATYRQSVAVGPQLSKRDPNNILLARGPQVRLQAELVRDHALSISGLLSDQIGGPSIKPYQPKGLWLQVASGNQPLKEYIQDHGQDLYRKSMYTFWKRSLPPPSMITFDASTREQCAVRRQSTSTPMQALVLLNDPQFTEASRLFAQRMLVEGGTMEEERIRFAFRLATSRHPNEKEVSLLADLLEFQKEIFKAAPERALRLLRIGEYPLNTDLDITELAAYTVVANAILNLTETIRKD
ncbi:MAG: DUF1553 domain-containing protein [Bacteroidetes bacterium]|nr:MAG: DUF1553 domain-containing protein [Bacteroidota bacterium]